MISVSAIFLWGAGSAVLALIGLFIARKTIKPIDLRQNSDLLLAMVTIVGTLVSILLGLLVSTTVDEYKRLDLSVDAEATYVGNIFRLARGIPDKTSDAVRGLCIEYCDLVINDEWPAMRTGKASSSVTAISAKLNDTIVSLRPSNFGEATVQQALLNASSELAECRRERIVGRHDEWIKRLLPILVMCSTIVLAFSYFYIRKGPMLLHAILVVLVAIVLGTNIGVIFLMGRPFSSEWSIQPDAFELIVRVMRENRNRALTNQ